MAIAEQFAGLDMKQLIGGPLSAAAEASTYLANSTAEFINKVGFDANGKARTVAFAYQQRSMNEDGTSNLDEMKVDVPMIAIVPIPNLQVDEVNILFDMEVKQSERSENALDIGASVTGSMNLGIIKVSVTGNISAHSSNTRSSDNSAKYHVDVRATNHGTPEGLARVLDIMAANVAPMLIGSSLKDGNGQNLSEQARIKAENLKTLRHEIRQLERQLSAANENFDSVIMQIKQAGTSQLNVYRGIFAKLKQNNADPKGETSDNGNNMDEVNLIWSDFTNRVRDVVATIADSRENPDKLSDMFALKGVDAKGAVVAYDQQSGIYYNELFQCQNNAVVRQRDITEIKKKLFEKNAEYNDALAGRKKEG